MNKYKKKMRQTKGKGNKIIDISNFTLGKALFLCYQPKNNLKNKIK